LSDVTSDVSSDEALKNLIFLHLEFGTSMLSGVPTDVSLDRGTQIACNLDQGKWKLRAT
jgi:hypothetical protein